jgi:hypothetical protein
MTTPTAAQKMLRSIHIAIARASPSWPTGSRGFSGERFSISIIMICVSQ